MNPEHKTCAAVCYVERYDGKILCVWNKRYGRWGWPGGKVEPNEIVEDAAIRELYEETGCRIYSVPELLFEGSHGESVESTRGSYVYVYRVEIDILFGPKEMEEGCAVTWFTRDEFLKWGIAPGFYKKFFEILDGKG